MFKTIEIDHVKAVNADDGWEGAASRSRRGAASKRGVEYEIATGELIPNLGEK